MWVPGAPWCARFTGANIQGARPVPGPRERVPLGRAVEGAIPPWGWAGVSRRPLGLESWGRARWIGRGEPQKPVEFGGGGSLVAPASGR